MFAWSLKHGFICLTLSPNNKFEQFLLFPLMFSKDLYYRPVKTRACIGELLVEDKVLKYIKAHYDDSKIASPD